MTHEEYATAIQEKRFKILWVASAVVQAIRDLHGMDHPELRREADFAMGAAQERGLVPEAARVMRPSHDPVSGDLVLLYVHTTFDPVVGNETNIPRGGDRPQSVR